MKKLINFCVVLVFFGCLFGMYSCGSSWNIEGNNMFIYRVSQDTIAPAGSYIMIPGSVK